MKIIVIGASTGGPQTLDMLLLGLPAKMRAPIVIMQHMPQHFTASMAARMNVQMPQDVSELKDGEILRPGHVYIVPGDQNFYLESPEIKSRFIPNNTHESPSINIGFTTSADCFGPKTIAVVLTGMGEDGLSGAKAVKQMGGYVIAQDEESSVIYGMPQVVAKAGYADEILSLEDISKRLIELVKH